MLFKAYGGYSPAAKCGAYISELVGDRKRGYGQKSALLCHIHTRQWVKLLQALSLSSFGQTRNFHTEGGGSPAVNLQLTANSVERTDDGLKV